MKHYRNVLFFLTSLLIISFNSTSLSQGEIASLKTQNIPEVRADKDFKWKYQRQLRMLKRVYPMALKAKELITDYNKDLQEIDKKRQKKKYGKEAHNELKDQFTFNIKDLYQSEGQLLMKLIHRETGMTVKDIISNYRGGLQPTIYKGMATLWGQNLDAEYNPEGDDWITELVIYDIQQGNVDFDFTMQSMDKTAYKESMKDYRSRKKKNKKKRKEMQKQLKNQEAKRGKAEAGKTI